MLRIITCLKNQELEQWLSSEFNASSITALTKEELKQAVRNSLNKRREPHLGIRRGEINESSMYKEGFECHD